MKVIHNSLQYYGKEFCFNKLFGCLVCKKRKHKNANANAKYIIKGEKRQCIEAVHNPYMMNKRDLSYKGNSTKNKPLTRIYAKLLTWLCAYSYPLAQLFTRLHFNIFENAGDASRFYYSVYPSSEHQRILCLPRAIFIATTSRRFKEHGVLFVGAFLPTVRMHAWVIEDCMPADIWDNQWICFQPVMIIL